MDEDPGTEELTFAEWFDHIDVAALVQVNSVRWGGRSSK